MTNIAAINHDRKLDINKYLELKTRKVILILSIVSFILLVSLSILKFLSNDKIDALFNSINTFFCMISIILVLRNKHIFAAILSIYSIFIILIIYDIFMLFFNRESFNFLYIILHSIDNIALITLAGFILGRKHIIIIGSISIFIAILTTIISANESLIENILIPVLIITVVCIVNYYFTGLFTGLLFISNIKTKEQKELREKFKYSISLSIDSANNTSEVLTTSFNQIENLINSMITRLKNIEENSKNQSNNSFFNTKELKKVMNSLKNIDESVDNQLELIKTADRKANELTEDTKSISEIYSNTKSGFSSLLESVETGKQSITKNLIAIENIKNSSDIILSLNKEIKELSESTKVLSINSSIEAANAGVYGTGFKVLSEEVRKLAMKSSEAAKNIDEAVNLISNRIEISANTSQNASETFNNILDNIKEFDKYVNKISGITEVQYQSTNRINELIKDTLLRMENIVISIRKTDDKLNHIMNNSKNIELLSSKTLDLILNQITDNSKISLSISDMSRIINNNRNISKEMNDIVKSIDE